MTGGSYIKDIYPNMSSVAFMFECLRGRGQIFEYFPEQSTTACAYRAELMGLLAIHLILCSINVISIELNGTIEIFSDCLEALGRVAKLPPHRIPSQCHHSYILKTIIVNCPKLTCDLVYTHVEAHQYDAKFMRLWRDQCN